LIFIGKGIAVTLLTVIPTVLAIVVVTNAIHDSGVVMTICVYRNLLKRPASRLKQRRNSFSTKSRP
jgi:hypothetical protein